ncbi:MAG TPA: BamA/TamA family outer membrane protein [Blastocatellia bacterium]|nr:BamA/TamA family outer membrane protein [Blastocatellia bacterium]
MVKPKQSMLIIALPLFVATLAKGQDLASTTAALQPRTNQQFYLRFLNVSGNKKTHLEVILRMIPLRETDLFDQVRWEQGIDALNRSGLFNPITNADYVFILDHALGVVDIELRVTERDYQRVDINGGGGTTGDVSVGLDYSHANLTGRADKLLVRGLFGDRERSIVGNYSTLIWSKTPISLNASGYYQQTRFVSAQTSAGDRQTLFADRTGGASVGLFVPLGLPRFALSAPTRAGLVYSLSTSNVADSFTLVSGARTTIKQSGLRIGSLTPTLVRDTRDRGFDPQIGELLAFGVELGARALGGRMNLVRPYFDYRRFFPLGRGSAAADDEKRERRVIAFGVRGSFIAAFGEPFPAETLSTVDGVPIFKRFFLGGETQVRGYDVNSIAPLARVQRFAVTGTASTLVASDIRPIGGDTDFVFNAEYRIPIVWRLSAAAFFDFGASFNSRALEPERFETGPQTGLSGSSSILTVLTPLASIEDTLPRYRFSLGGEFRFPIPVLNIPIRLIFALNPNAQQNVPTSTFLAPEKRFAFRIGFSRTL